MTPSKSKRLRLLQSLANYERQGEFPLLRELAQSLGYQGESSIRRMIDSLVNDGYLQNYGGGRERHRRILALTPKAHDLLHSDTFKGGAFKGIPVLGEIPAGPLQEAVQECSEFVTPNDFLTTRPHDFFLRVKGNSMTGDGILPGDLVLIRPGVQVENGEIAALQIHGEHQSDATLKHIHWQPGKRTVRLRASNPAYEDLTLPASEVIVVGAYRGLMRHFD